MYALIILLVTILISIVIFPIFPLESFAHRDGCHRWHSCPSDTGSYVCGDLGYYAYCGTPSVPTFPTPTVPVTAPSPAPTSLPIPPVDECANAMDDDADRLVDSDDAGCEVGSREACRMTTVLHVHRRTHRHAGGRRHVHRLRHKHLRVRCPA